MAAVWESPDGTGQALAVDRADGSTYITNPGQVLISVTPTPGGMLALREDYYKVGILRSSGAMDPVSVKDAPVDPEPGDVAVDLGGAGLWEVLHVSVELMIPEELSDEPRARQRGPRRRRGQRARWRVRRRKG